MARAFVYQRSIDAVLTDLTFYDKLNHPVNGIKVKEEPPDPDTHDHDDSSSVGNIGATIRNKSTELEDQFSNSIHDKENESVLSREYADLENRTSGLDGRKRKCLPSRNSREQAFRRKWSRGCLDIAYRKRKKKSMYIVECDVCFLPFIDESRLRYHKINYATSKCTCDVCKGVFNTASILIRHKQRCLYLKDNTVQSGGRYICDFCKRIFSSKIQLQAHLFHSHENLVATPAATEVVETEGNALTENTDHRVGNGNADEVKEKNLLEENGKNRVANIDATERSNDPSNSSVRKLRQTTLTEFRSFFGKKRKEELVNPDNVASTERTERENSLRIVPIESNSSTNKIPFVQIHVNSNTMAVLLKDKIKTELEDRYGPTTPRKISYNLRRIGREDVDRSQDELDGEPTAGTFAETNSIARRKRKRENGLLRERNTELEYECKDCVVRLERCDDEILNKGNFEIDESESTLLQIDSIKIEENAENDRATSPSHLTLKALRVPVVRVDKLVKIQVKKSLIHREESDSIEDKIEQVGDTMAFECKICKKFYPSKKNMDEHVEQFHVVYMSSICKARYTSRNKLLSHYLSQHAVFNRKECCVCHVKLDTPMTLKRHMVLHCIKFVRSENYDPPIDREVTCNAFRKRNRCEACGKRFWLSLCLNQHRRMCGRANENRKMETPAASTSATFIPDYSPGSSGPRRNTSVVVDETESTINSILRCGSLSSRSPSSGTRANGSRLRIVGIRKSSIGSTVVPANRYQINRTGTDRVKFPCVVCDKQFQTFRNLCLHERTFCKPATNPCTVCGTAFTTKRLLQLHVLATHAPFCSLSCKYFCKFCNQGFVKKANLQVHERHFHTDGATVTISASRENEEHVWNINTVCTVCNLLFESYERFIEHNKYYYKGQVFTCTFCTRSFHGMYMLDRHNKLTHYPEITRNSYTYTCDRCNEGFREESHFHAHKLHVHSHEASPKKTMQDHNYALTTKNVSVDAHVNVPLMAYTCDICTLYFTNESDLRMHEMEYSLDGDFHCSECDKKYRTAAILVKHQSLTHNGRGVIGNYCKCRFCGEVLTTNASMACHEKHFHASDSVTSKSKRNAAPDRLHRNQGFVEEDAVRSSNRTDHLTCLTCDTRFENETELKDHLSECSDIGTYSCAICHRKFAEVHRLELHRTKHSRLNIILSEHHCPVCHEGFSSAIDVRMHVLHGYEIFPSIVIGRSDDTRGKKNSVNEFQSHETVSISSSTVRPQGSHPLKCPECEIIFDTRGNLFKHRSRFADTGDYMCEYCGRKFLSLVLLEAHASNHIADGRDRSTEHKCVRCDETFRNPLSRYSHIVHVHGRDKLNAHSIDTDKPIDLLFDCSKYDFDTLIGESIDDFQQDRFAPASENNLAERYDGSVEEPIDAPNSVNEYGGEREIASWTVVDTSTETYTVQEDEDSEDKEEKTVRYTCPVCNLIYPTLKRFRSHFRLTHRKTIHGTIPGPALSDNENLIVCMFCGSTFAEERRFTEHTRTVHASLLATARNGTKQVPAPLSTILDSDAIKLAWEKKTAAVNEHCLSKTTKRLDDSDVQVSRKSYFGPIIKYVGEISLANVANATSDVCKLKIKSFAKFN